MIKKVFPTLSLEPDFVCSMLSDLTDEAVMRATLEIIQTRVEIYPGTNWIALIRSVASRCRICDGKGVYVSETGYEIQCKCIRRKRI